VGHHIVAVVAAAVLEDLFGFKRLETLVEQAQSMFH
jgi:hypothetical protein